MLNRRVCRACRQRVIAFDDGFDDRWDDEGIVYCEANALLPIRVSGDMPRFCTFKTEQVVSQDAE